MRLAPAQGVLAAAAAPAVWTSSPAGALLLPAARRAVAKPASADTFAQYMRCAFFHNSPPHPHTPPSLLRLGLRRLVHAELKALLCGAEGRVAHSGRKAVGARVRHLQGSWGVADHGFCRQLHR